MTRQISRRRPDFLTGTALAAALALGGTLGLWATPAAAQGFVGTVTSTTGGVSISPDQSDIAISTAEAVINWRAAGAATDTNVAFLPAGSSVTFHEQVSFPGTDYTVLNRVIPQTLNGATGLFEDIPATISIAGNINATFGGQQGGNIWFYSPHGIVTNGKIGINVGSLLLTTSDIDTSSGSLYLSQAAGNQIGFLPATDPNGVVRIGADTSISAAGNASSALAGYVGVFAPRIEQGGSIRSSGMVGLAAAEAGTITFNAGLVDIQITQGTAESQGNGIVHTGTTGGGAAAAGQTKQIQMVAMPKATALTMLLGGSIGYDAAAATPDGSAVILSSGWTNATTPGEIALARGNMRLNNLVIGNPSTLYATGMLDVAPQLVDAATPGLVRFTGDAQLWIGQALNLTAGAGEQIDATGSLSVDPLAAFAGEAVKFTVTGDPAIDPAPGQITIAGTLDIDASGRPGIASVFPDTGENGTGGAITFDVAQGKLTTGTGPMLLTAHGQGGDGNLLGGNGRGGTIDIRVSGGGTISSPTALDVRADGLGGNGLGDGSLGGTGTGAAMILRDDGGTLGFTQVRLVGNGYGATGLAASQAGSDGLGGNIAVTIGGQAQTWDTLFVDASAYNGNPQFGAAVAGNALGNPGGAKLQVTGAGRLTLSGLSLINNAVISSGGDTASLATAGGVDLRVDAGGQLTVNGQALLEASGLSQAGNPPVGAIMAGGNVGAVVDGAGSVFKVNSLTGAADAWLAGAGVTAGSATGGQLAVGATNGGLLQVAGANAQVRLGAVAHTGYGQVAQSIEGGNARLYVQGGTIDAAGVTLNVSAAAIGDGSAYDGTNTGYSARGGSAAVELLAGGSGPGSITAGDIVINAKGEAVSVVAADPFADFTGPYDNSAVRTFVGDGGTGQGGTAQLWVQTGTLTAGTIRVHANGLGGTAGYDFNGSTFQAGDGTGGQAFVDQSGGTVIAGSLDVLSEGHGGMIGGSMPFDQQAPLPGVGRGGTARVSLSGGAMTLSGALGIAARAVGGAGAGAQGNAGSASATAGALGDGSLSLAELLMPAGSTAVLSAASATVAAVGVGGDGALDEVTGTATNGGAAIGGTARYSLADGAFTLGATLADATATGGASGTGAPGGIGGNATGGTAAFLLADTLAAPATQRSTGALLLTASPVGGVGTAANGTAAPGTTKFTARAARAASALVIGGSFAADANGTVLAGDGFTGNFGAVPVQVNGDFTVTTTRDINMSLDPGGGTAATGAIALTGQSITTTGTGVLAAAGTATVLAVNSINLGGLSAGGTTLLEALNPGGNVPGPVFVAGLSSGGPVTARGSAVSIGSPGSLTFAEASAVGGNLTVATAGDLTIVAPGAASATGNANLASGGQLHLAGALSAVNIALQAGGSILTDAGVTTLGSFSALAAGTYTGALALVVPGSTSIDAAGGITLPSLTSGGTTFLRAANGAIPLLLTSAGPVTLAAQSAAITSPGSLAFTSAATTAGDLAIVTTGTLGLGGASATGALNLTVGGLLSVTDAAEGATITVRSPDIAIGAGGRLGRRGQTTAILLVNTAPATGTFIGGAGGRQQGAWTLDAAEAARLFADQSLTITPAASAAGLGAVTIGGLTLSYGPAGTANLGSGGQVIVQTPGAIRVTGQVALAASTNADAFALTGGSIDVVTDSGGIAMTGSGALLGTLRLTADAVRVGTAAALSAVSGLPTAAAAGTRLDANDGLVNAAGTVRAGSLVVAFGSRFLIQNSGAGTQFDLRRGFAANTLAISTQNASAQIAINGVLLGAGRLTGGLTQRGTIINGLAAAAGGLFDPLSTINGCVIGRDCSTPINQVVPPFETLAGLIGPLGPPSSLLVLPVIQFGEMPLFDSPPLIDEPVTGVGNDDLWQQR